MLRRLPTAIVLGADDLLCSETIDAIRKEVITIVDTDLQRDIDRLVKTHLLRNRVESGKDKSLGQVSRRLRHYLTDVAVPAHRKAMTGLLLGDHNLSVERLRYGARYRMPVPREFRLCRFCRGSVEDEVHALFECAAEPRLIEFRADFLGRLAERDPGLRALYGSIPNYEFFARYIHLVLFALGLFTVYCTKKLRDMAHMLHFWLGTTSRSSVPRIPIGRLRVNPTSPLQTHAILAAPPTAFFAQHSSSRTNRPLRLVEHPPSTPTSPTADRGTQLTAAPASALPVPTSPPPSIPLNADAQNLRHVQRPGIRFSAPASMQRPTVFPGGRNPNLLFLATRVTWRRPSFGLRFDGLSVPTLISLSFI
ncbi:hypothetical protein B0H13DRAFT_2353537 [Mycena leptocephala]|nr:hypothetical protein B0H13DRAFT_2353537 [Mycena leptocephala]